MQIWNLGVHWVSLYIGVQVIKKTLHLKANLDYIYYGILC